MAEAVNILKWSGIRYLQMGSIQLGAYFFEGTDYITHSIQTINQENDSFLHLIPKRANRMFLSITSTNVHRGYIYYNAPTIYKTIKKEDKTCGLWKDRPKEDDELPPVLGQQYYCTDMQGGVKGLLCLYRGDGIWEDAFGNDVTLKYLNDN